MGPATISVNCSGNLLRTFAVNVRYNNHCSPLTQIHTEGTTNP